MSPKSKSTLVPAEIPVVGIGYSAGGLEAIQTILSGLSSNSGMAFVVIQHLQPDFPSHLDAILSKSSRLPVKTIQNGMRIEPNTVFVIPPGCDVVLNGDFLNLNPRGQSSVHHLGVDFFFASLAQNRKTKAIGVVLSGTGADGTLGLKAIKAEGGITIVQDPKTATFDGMPRSAIASGIADLILAPKEIAIELDRLAKHPYTKAALTGVDVGPSTEAASSLEEPSIFDKILQILFDQTKIDFSLYKSSTIRRRIERQMMLRKIETIGKYADYLQKNPDEVKALYEDIFIHVTDFFRDSDSFDALREKAFPEIIKGKSKEKPIRFWVPGCATGEEVYSLSILMLEYLEEHSLKIPLHIFGSDISEPALQKARKGVYSDSQMRNVSAQRLEKYFEKIKDGYKVKKNVRDMCIFSRHDVTNNPPIPQVDLVSCRNVLIYFSTELQKRLFPVFHYALTEKGFLWLGRAENPEATTKLFAAVDKVHKIFTKSRSSTPHPHRFSTPSFAPALADLKFPTVTTMTRAGDIARNADQVILYRYSPPSVLVDSDGEILQFRGRTVPYLEPSPGLASHSLLKMANPEIAAPLRVCLQSAKKENAQVRKENVEFEFEGKTRKTSIDISPLNPAAPAKERLYLVVFEDGSAAKAAKTKPKPLPKNTRGGKNLAAQVESLSQHVTHLQQELDASREYQQSLAEEYESSQEELTSANEELRSTNEELQSTNEELHSANEELGSAKEELQAANEELLSTNEELQRRNEELERAIREVAAGEQKFQLMVSAVKDYAIFMLDAKGHVSSWNEGAKRIKGYEAEEIIGKHFSRFYPPEDVARRHPEQELELAARDGRYEEEGWRIRKDGSRFWANVVITALREADGTLVGFTKVTRDLTERRNADERLKQLNESLERKVEERTAEAERAVKLRDEFLSIASHELKTPLTSLGLQAQIRLHNLDKGNLDKFTPDKLRKLFDDDNKQISRLTRLVEEMLDTSRITSGKFELRLEPTDLGILVKDVIERFSAQLQKAGIELSLDVRGDILGNWDRYRLEQVFTNLLTNAIKYGAGKPVEVKAFSKAGRAYFTIKDQGIGIAEEDRGRIFIQFERAVSPSAVSGLGLGLYIVKRIIESHGGTVRVESELGRGSTFTVEVPLEPPTQKSTS